MEKIKMCAKLLEVKELTSKKGNPFYLGSFVSDEGQVFKCILDGKYALPAFSDVELTFDVNIDWNQNLTLKQVGLQAI